MMGGTVEIGNALKPRSAGRADPPYPLVYHTLAVSTFSERNLSRFLTEKTFLVMAKAKHHVAFIVAPVYPDTDLAVAKLTNLSEHPAAKGPPRDPNDSY